MHGQQIHRNLWKIPCSLGCNTSSYIVQFQNYRKSNVEG